MDTLKTKPSIKSKKIINKDYIVNTTPLPDVQCLARQEPLLHSGVDVDDDLAEVPDSVPEAFNVPCLPAPTSIRSWKRANQETAP